MSEPTEWCEIPLDLRIYPVEPRGFEFTNTSGHPIYTVIFATSNDTGEKIMADVFAKHGVALERMRKLAQAERQLRKEDPGLFGADEVADMLMSATGGREPLLPPIEPVRYKQNPMQQH